MYIVLLFILSSFSKLPGPEFIPDFDKFEHFTAYLILSLLFYRAFMGMTKLEKQKCAILSVICTISYGMSDEIHQFFVPGRDASLLDLLFDTFGAILAFGSLLNELREIIEYDSRMSGM